MTTITKANINGTEYNIGGSVVSVDNHYTPAADAESEITGTLSGTAGAYAKDTVYTVLTGVKAQRDEKGHVVGLTYTAQNVKDTNTTYSSKAAASGGTAASLVTTGEKYTWNSKQDALVFNTAYNASTNKVATMSDIPSTLPASDVSAWAKEASKPAYTLDEVSDGSTRKLSNYQTKVSALGSTTKPVYVSAAGTFAECNSYPTTLPASDVYSWAKESTKPSYTLDEVTDGSTRKLSNYQTKVTALGSTTKPVYISASGTFSECNSYPTTLPASDVSAWAKAASKPTYTLSEVGASMSVVNVSSNTSSTCSITGSSNAGKSQTIIYSNSTSTDYTVTVPTTYSTPDGAAIELTCPGGGYCEVSYINISGTVYARGL